MFVSSRFSFLSILVFAVVPLFLAPANSEGRETFQFEGGVYGDVRVRKAKGRILFPNSKTMEIRIPGVSPTTVKLKKRFRPRPSKSDTLEQILVIGSKVVFRRKYGRQFGSFDYRSKGTGKIDSGGISYRTDTYVGLHDGCGRNKLNGQLVTWLRTDDGGVILIAGRIKTRGSCAKKPPPVRVRGDIGGSGIRG